MKRYFLLIAFFCTCMFARGQSIGLIDLTNLTSLKAIQIDSYFESGKLFKLQFGEDVNEFVVKHWQLVNKDGKTETVLTGAGTKTASGGILYTASYVTNDPQNIVHLLVQVKGAGLKLTFEGSDPTSNIYIYDSVLYHAVFKIRFDQASASVDVTQKIEFTQ